MAKILIIDDEKELHPVLLSYFPKDQFRVISAYDGLEGLQKCRNEVFDYIIVDFRMPKLDGIKFYQQLRDLQEKAKVESTPVIFMSGFVEDIKAKEIKYTKCEFLSKPFTKEDLFQKLLKPSSVKIENKITLNPGEVLFQEGEDTGFVYYVVRGLLETSKLNSEGQKYVVGKVGTGELLGEMAILNQDRNILTATAIERTELIGIPSDKILSIVNGQPKWIKLMIENLSKRLQDTIKQIA